MKRLDLILGEKYNRLTILNEVEPEERMETRYGKMTTIKTRRVYCLCDCGGNITTRLSMVRQGRAKSCGCIGREKARLNNNQTTHGLSYHPLHHVWASMKARCFNKSNPAYKDYGGRGITVCKRWLKFINFYNDLIDSYKNGLKLERRNNNQIYKLSNCYWATPKIQANNRRNTIYVSIKKKKYPLTTACDMLGLSTRLIRERMRRLGLSFEQSITHTRRMFTDLQIKEIRESFKNGMSQQSIKAKFCVSISLINQIINNTLGHYKINS